MRPGSNRRCRQGQPTIDQLLADRDQPDRLRQRIGYRGDATVARIDFQVWLGQFSAPAGPLGSVAVAAGGRHQDRPGRRRCARNSCRGRTYLRCDWLRTRPGGQAAPQSWAVHLQTRRQVDTQYVDGSPQNLVGPLIPTSLAWATGISKSTLTASQRFTSMFVRSRGKTHDRNCISGKRREGCSRRWL